VDAFTVCGKALTLFAEAAAMPHDEGMQRVEESARALFEAQEARNKWVADARARVEAI
jgi:hypothetical protein